MTDHEQLIQQIEAAFADIERGNGQTLHEAAEFVGNDYCVAEERARVRALDLETRWQDIPDTALEECQDRWSFDEEGFRFHLPAYMRWHLRKPQSQFPTLAILQFNDALRATGAGSYRHLDKRRSEGIGPRSLQS
jgi:hypothetical protein